MTITTPERLLLSHPRLTAVARARCTLILLDEIVAAVLTGETVAPA